jgi:hypothetical protein
MQILESERYSISFIYDPGTPVLVQPGDVITINTHNYSVREVRLQMDGTQEVEADLVFSPSGPRIQDQVRAVRAMVAMTRKVLMEKFPEAAISDALINELVTATRQAMRLSLAKLMRQALQNIGLNGQEFDGPIRELSEELQRQPWPAALPPPGNYELHVEYSEYEVD